MANGSQLRNPTYLSSLRYYLENTTVRGKPDHLSTKLAGRHPGNPAAGWGAGQRLRDSELSETSFNLLPTCKSYSTEFFRPLNMRLAVFTRTKKIRLFLNPFIFPSFPPGPYFTKRLPDSVHTKLSSKPHELGASLC